MMQSRSISRELALLVLGQIPDNETNLLKSIPIDSLLNKALQSLLDSWHEDLELCAGHLETAQQHLLDSELQELDKDSLVKVRGHLNTSLLEAEGLLNSLSASLELPRFLALSDQEVVRSAAINYANLVIKQRFKIDSDLDNVMEGWRLKRLPKIDRDILRLAFVDLTNLQTPIAVTCNEAVELANRYSDEQGRRMINGVLRRLQIKPKGV